MKLSDIIRDRIKDMTTEELNQHLLETRRERVEGASRRASKAKVKYDSDLAKVVAKKAKELGIDPEVLLQQLIEQVQEDDE